MLRQLANDAVRALRGPGPGEIPKAYLRDWLPDDPMIVESGAHTGEDTRGLARAWPRGTVHTFEPVPALFARMTAATRGLANVRRYPLALGAATGEATMHVSGGRSDGSSSLLAPRETLLEHPDVTFSATIAVSVITLDAWAAARGIAAADLLWLDMQGYELAALRAGERLLRTVRVIHSEVSLKELYAGAPLYPEYRAWLASRGFRVAREELPWPDGGNVVFVRDRGSHR